MIRYLEEDEILKSRDLYEQSFPEDSNSFVNYYYSEKIKTSRVLISEDEYITSMLHQNSYKMKLKNEIRDIDYIVAVATDKRHRRKGLMRSLLKYALNTMYEGKKPITFLLPADKAYYEPFDFNFISSYYEYNLDKDIEIKRYTEDDYESLLEFCALYFRDNYELYCIRDEAYLDRLIKELKSEEGYIELLYKEEKLVGYRLIWGLEKKMERGFVSQAADKHKTKAAYMARIVNIYEFAKLFKLKKDYKEDNVRLTVHIEDAFLEQNEGFYEWELDKSGATLVRLDGKPQDEYISLRVNELISYLCGYSDVYEAELGFIDRIIYVYIDEVV